MVGERREQALWTSRESGDDGERPAETAAEVRRNLGDAVVSRPPPPAVKKLGFLGFKKILGNFSPIF